MGVEVGMSPPATAAPDHMAPKHFQAHNPVHPSAPPSPRPYSPDLLICPPCPLPPPPRPPCPLPDHLKLHLPLSWSVSTLALGMLMSEDGYRASGQWDVGSRNLRYVAEYLIKCHVTASDTPAANTFVAQVR